MNPIPAKSQKPFKIITIMEACCNCKHSIAEEYRELGDWYTYYKCSKFPDWNDSNHIDEDGFIRDCTSFKCEEYESIKERK